MTIVVQTTQDGSDTCFNEKFNQAYHSKFGAYREALEKHVLACKIPELARNLSDESFRKDSIPYKLKILDICFGLGYNSFVAIDEVHKINPELFVEVTGLENDIEILKKIPECKMPEEIKCLGALVTKGLGDLDTLTPGHRVTLLNEKNADINLVLGDARETIKTLEANYFDAVFFDPFSPAACPELWTEEFIRDVVSKAKPGAYLSTYSSARIVKDNFKKAGCEIFEGPLCGRRTGGVLARRL